MHLTTCSLFSRVAANYFPILITVLQDWKNSTIHDIHHVVWCLFGHFILLIGFCPITRDITPAVPMPILNSYTRDLTTVVFPISTLRIRHSLVAGWVFNLRLRKATHRHASCTRGIWLLKNHTESKCSQSSMHTTQMYHSQYLCSWHSMPMV